MFKIIKKNEIVCLLLCFLNFLSLPGRIASPHPITGWFAKVLGHSTKHVDGSHCFRGLVEVEESRQMGALNIAKPCHLVGKMGSRHISAWRGRGCASLCLCYWHRNIEQCGSFVSTSQWERRLSSSPERQCSLQVCLLSEHHLLAASSRSVSALALGPVGTSTYRHD